MREVCLAKQFVKRGRRWVTVETWGEVLPCVACGQPFTRIRGSEEQVCACCLFAGVKVDEYGRAVVGSTSAVEG